METVYWNPPPPRYRLIFLQDGEIRAGVWWRWEGPEALFLNTQILGLLKLTDLGIVQGLIDVELDGVEYDPT